jgi:Nitrile hydratase, alpha chain
MESERSGSGESRDATVTRRTRLRKHQSVQRIKLAIIRRALANPQYREAILSGGESLVDEALRATFDVPIRPGVRLKAVAETPDHLYLLVPYDVSDIWLPMAMIEDPIVQVTSRAATDTEFRQRLVARPKATLAEMFDIRLPADVDLEVLVDTADLRHVVVPVTGEVQAGVVAFKEALINPCLPSPNRTNEPCARNPDLTRPPQWCPYPPTTKLDSCSGVTTDDDCVTPTTDGDCSGATTDGCGTPSTQTCETPSTMPEDCSFFTLPCAPGQFTNEEAPGPCAGESCTDGGGDGGLQPTDGGCDGGLQQTDEECGGGGLNSPTTECGEGGADPITETGCTSTPDQPTTDDQSPLFF